MAQQVSRPLSIRMLFPLVPIAALAWAVTTPFGDNSFLWHVRAGTLQLDTGRVLTTDPFTVQYAGRPWRTQSWLAELLYGTLERMFDGLSWVPAFRFLTVALTVVVVLLLVWRRTGHIGITAAASLVLCWQALAFPLARPAVFNFVLLAVVAGALYERRALWAVPGLIWLWAMLHGAFVLGIGLVVLHAIRLRSRRHAELAVVGAVLATLTAHGLGVWQTLLSFAGSRDALGLIQEWQPPDYSNPMVLPFALLVLAAVYAAARGKLIPADLIIVLPFLFFGMLAVRNVYPAMIVALPYVSAGLVPTRVEHPRRDPIVVVAGFTLLIVLLAGVGLSRPLRLSERSFPPPEALARLEPGPLFHDMASGGYLIYAQWPERQVMLDDRAELFGKDGFDELLDITDGDGWEDYFDAMSIRQALLKPDWPLVRELEEAGWEELYRDDNFVVAAAPAS